MSDGITEARRGTYFKNDKYDKSIIKIANVKQIPVLTFICSLNI